MTIKSDINRNNLKTHSSNNPLSKSRWGTALMTGLGLTGALTGCNSTGQMLAEPVNAQNLPTSAAQATPLLPTPSPTIPPTATPTWTPDPTNTPWITPTPWPTAQAWQPVQLAVPTLAPVPVVSAPQASPFDTTPVSYAPPNGVDVFGSTLLRWTHAGPLAPDEWFDVKIKPYGSNDSIFVDWTKSTEYTLTSWSGWQPGLYQWQIGIVKGNIDANGTKHFIEDTGRDSELLVIKWQASGGGHSNNSGTSSGGSTGGSSGSGGGGGTSGGS